MDANNPSPEENDPNGSNRDEELRMENEILRMRIIAELGGLPGDMGNVPPEIENQFLKNVIAFEQQHTQYKPEKVVSLLGSTSFKKENELNDAAFDKEWQRLNELLEAKSMAVDFIRERDNRFKYRFITEELFQHETDSGMMMPGMMMNFIYEEFHPDHELDITNRTSDFFSAWFERNAESLNYGVVSGFIQPDRTVLSNEELIKKIRLVFDSYSAFENCKSKIFEVKFELREDGQMEGIGHSEGLVKYDAVLESGEKKHIEGPFKLYMSKEYDWWSIFYFVMPGFGE